LHMLLGYLHLHATLFDSLLEPQSNRASPYLLPLSLLETLSSDSPLASERLYVYTK